MSYEEKIVAESPLKRPNNSKEELLKAEEIASPVITLVCNDGLCH